MSATVLPIRRRIRAMTNASGSLKIFRLCVMAASRMKLDGEHPSNSAARLMVSLSSADSRVLNAAVLDLGIVFDLQVEDKLVAVAVVQAG